MARETDELAAMLGFVRKSAEAASAMHDLSAMLLRHGRRMEGLRCAFLADCYDHEAEYFRALALDAFTQEVEAHHA